MLLPRKKRVTFFLNRETPPEDGYVSGDQKKFTALWFLSNVTHTGRSFLLIDSSDN